MSSHTKTSTPALLINAIGLILGIAGVITMIISSTMNTANALYGLPKLIILAILGIALVALLLVAPQSWKKNGYLSLVSIMAAIALFTYVIGNVLNSRILLVSGLFSYNSGNTAGWSVFYVTVASLVCFLAAILTLVISGFSKSNK